MSDAAGPFTEVVVEADGGSRGNPGPAGYGAVVLDRSDRVLAERSEAIGRNTNNVAEYRGLIAGLQAAAAIGARIVHVRMDSKLVVEQMSGNWQVKHEALRALAKEASALRREFDGVTFEWIPRERNKRADKLANDAMDRAAGITRRVRTEPVTAAAGEETPTQQLMWTPPSMAPTRLILVRHGATEHSVDHRFSGHNDLPLSELGRRQAAALAQRFAAGAPLAAVLSSPLPRAMQTAQHIAEAVGTRVMPVDGLAEVNFGEWEGLTFAEVADGFPAQLRAWSSSPRTAPPGGESFDDAAVRVLAARDDLLDRFAQSTVGVVTHVTPIKLLVRDVLAAGAISLWRMHLDTGSVTVLNSFGDGNSSMTLFNDTSHLASIAGSGSARASRADDA